MADDYDTAVVCTSFVLKSVN